MGGVTESKRVECTHKRVSSSRSTPYRRISASVVLVSPFGSRLVSEFCVQSASISYPAGLYPTGLRLICIGVQVRPRQLHHSDLGAVAQLGERLICIQEVAGSIPTSSTSVESHWACSSDG